MAQNNKVVSREEWLTARKVLLTREKAFTQARDELSRERRALPWTRVDENYVFQGSDGEESLDELFAGRQQLAVYHFMFAPDAAAGCSNCSFWADSFNGIHVHLAHRDVSFVAVSRAPYEKLAAFRKRLGWSFKWVSSGNSTFNHDYHVLFTPEELAGGAEYNYELQKVPRADLHGMSAFYRDAAGAIYHTYSSYSRGIDILNAAYAWLDLMPKGRDEPEVKPSSWVRLHDNYEG